MSMVVLAMISVLLTGCSFSHHAMALFRSTDHFIESQDDARILFEPGAGNYAEKVSALLPLAIQQIETKQYHPFPKPVQVYVCASRESFAKYYGADVRAGVSSKLLLSPRVFDQGDEIARLYLTHELSHLHLLQLLGSYKMRRLPFWFKEGLATYVSEGGGANKVSEKEALAAFHRGKHFIPNRTGGIFTQKTPSDFNLKPHMFYRQSMMFVSYLEERNRESFRKFLLAVEQGEHVSYAMDTSYNEDLEGQWSEFMGKIALTL
ncbi:MAG TPA: hypothetical protein EYG88_12595 [Desulfocapsa sulfexigens]|nr:hypothetical protein [Desulfocapsa sulfexigens]